MVDENTNAIQVQEQNAQTTPIKRGKGRPKGSKNKPKQAEKQEKNEVGVK